MQLHEQIKLMRTIKGLSREKMAEEIGMSINGYAKIERGETNLQVARLEKIAEVFGIELRDLLSLNENMVFGGKNNQQYNCMNHQNNYIDSAKDMLKELEKSRLLIEQQAKEIDYLKEIVDILKKTQKS